MHMRPGYVGSLYAMLGAVLAPAFVLGDLLPLAIWLTAVCLVIMIGRGERT